MRPLICLRLFAATAIAKEPSTYTADYSELKKRVSPEKMEDCLEGWRKREPDNPDSYILSANWYFEQAMSSVSITTKPPTGKDFELRDQKGNVAGSISSGSSAGAKDKDSQRAAQDALRKLGEK